jgi:hypothetical protein
MRRRTARAGATGVSWPSPRTVAVGIGYALLAATVSIVLFFPNGWLPIALAVAATALLAFDRKLGPLPAALFVMLALPVGRGSEVGLPRILGDVPVRAHDLVPLVAVVLALPAVVGGLRRLRDLPWPSLAPIGVFSAVAILALAIGVVNDQALRDVVRDARWWAFYGIGVLALVAGIRPQSILRALVWGLTIYAAILLIGLLMPMFHGGLKYGAYAYDPRLRLHYGQAAFLLPAVAFLVERFIRRPTAPTAAAIALLAAAVGVTLTRTLLAGLVGVAVLTAAWTAYRIWTDRGRPGAAATLRGLALRGVAPVLATLIGIGGGFVVYQFGITIWTPDWAYAPTEDRGISGAPTDTRPVRPSLDRVFEDTENSGFSAQGGGRLISYGLAFADTAEAPVLGHGIGQQARIPWAWGGFRARETGYQPGVDNAYLTVGLKAGAIGIAAFGAMVLWPLRQSFARHRSRFRTWFVPAWLALLGLMLLQSFAVSGYAPFVIALLLALPGARGVRRRVT